MPINGLQITRCKILFSMNRTKKALSNLTHESDTFAAISAKISILKVFARDTSDAAILSKESHNNSNEIKSFQNNKHNNIVRRKKKKSNQEEELKTSYSQQIKQKKLSDKLYKSRTTWHEEEERSSPRGHWKRANEQIRRQGQIHHLSAEFDNYHQTHHEGRGGTYHETVRVKRVSAVFPYHVDDFERPQNMETAWHVTY